MLNLEEGEAFLLRSSHSVVPFGPTSFSVTECASFSLLFNSSLCAHLARRCCLPLVVAELIKNVARMSDQLDLTSV